MKSAAPEHYALVNAAEVNARHADPTWQGFVEPLSYGASHGELAEFILRYFPPSVEARPRRTSGDNVSPTGVVIGFQGTRVLRDYRAFLLRDCGQMTIEGIRADIETAQRKFDLERLFVPLQVLPAPPEIPETDPQREKKLVEWGEKHKKPLPFGKVFAKNRRLALLALPGGGKTLLLKRLAVAYADPARRESSGDQLPDLDLFPVLIRCREWREHIHRPILTLLQSIPEITGQTGLSGLSDALIPLFRKGLILLLVDGLDEIHDDALRATFVDNLEKFLNEHALVRVVVTSREAGFSLVAPCLARFCERWRVAPLQPEAITALCNHWHLLMAGDSAEAKAESGEFADSLLRNESLRRLAENPLLLTMLLVVKHGAGRLPPDRVSLYGRAVEILLDTWNIRGHAPLNLKEAVPQLAFVAFQMMRAGKQTATESDLLGMLEEAREKVPQIRRYAMDNPQEFLRRVELRSSLLVEAGRQSASVGTVPFYQFRHLTFQEYLAAVAVVEGHYMEYQKTDTVLTPLAPYLTSEEWKEVIPMTAVLAKKQAEPLIAALVKETAELRRKAEKGEEFPQKQQRLFPGTVPPAARLTQCLAEEAEAAPATLAVALQLIPFFARIWEDEVDWGALGRGPYGEELLHQAWLLFESLQPKGIPRASEPFVTFALVSAFRLPRLAPEVELRRLLASEIREEVARGLAACAGLLWGEGRYVGRRDTRGLITVDDITKYIFSDDPALWVLAVWAWSLYRGDPSLRAKHRPRPSNGILDRITELFLREAPTTAVEMAAFGVMNALQGLPRGFWQPKIGSVQKLKLMASEGVGPDDEGYRAAASLTIAFHAGDIWPEEELASRLSTMRIPGDSDPAVSMLEQMGEVGQKYIKAKQRLTH